MSARAPKVAGTAIPRPFLAVIDVELPGEKARRNEVSSHKTFDAARRVAIRCRETFDGFFGDDADFFVMRVVDLRDYTVKFEYH